MKNVLICMIVCMSICSCGRRKFQTNVQSHAELIGLKGSPRSITLTALNVFYDETEKRFNKIDNDVDAFYSETNMLWNNDILFDGLGCTFYGIDVNPYNFLLFDKASYLNLIVFNGSFFYDIRMSDRVHMEFNNDGYINRIKISANDTILSECDYAYSDDKVVYNLKYSTGNQIMGEMKFLSDGRPFYIIKKYKVGVKDSTFFSYTEIDNGYICNVHKYDTTVFNLYTSENGYLQSVQGENAQYIYDNGILVSYSSTEKRSKELRRFYFEGKRLDSIYLLNSEEEAVKIQRDNDSSITGIRRNIKSSSLENHSFIYKYDFKNNWIELEYNPYEEDIQKNLVYINNRIDIYEAVHNSSLNYESKLDNLYKLFKAKIDKEYYLIGTKKIIVNRSIDYY